MQTCIFVLLKSNETISPELKHVYEYMYFLFGNSHDFAANKK